MWEFFLAKVEGKTYAEFLGEVERTEPDPVDMEQVEVTVQKSMNILENFSLNYKGTFHGIIPATWQNCNR